MFWRIGQRKFQGRLVKDICCPRLPRQYGAQNGKMKIKLQ
jgi:hypothetical protein